MLLKYPETLFECVNCGFCCRDSGRHVRRIVLTPADANRISHLANLPLDEFCKPTHHASSPFFRIMKKEFGNCIFLNDNSMCRVYDSRPMICRCYPFAVEFGDRGITFLPPAKDCPGVGRGGKLGREFFEKLAQEVADSYLSSSKTHRGPCSR